MDIGNTVIIKEVIEAIEALDRETKQDSRQIDDPLKVEPPENGATSPLVGNEHIVGLPITEADANNHEKNPAKKAEKNELESTSKNQTCSVPGCKPSNEESYRFPKAGACLQLWLKACNVVRKDLPNAKDPRICSKHFTSEQFRLSRGRTLLVKDAIPILNLPEVREGLNKRLVRPRKVKQSTYITSESLKEAKSVTNTWECNLCQYSTHKRSVILKHYKTSHTNVKDFKCSVCQYSTKWKWSILQHYKNAHSTIRDFKCNFCEYSTNWKNLLEQHTKAVHLNIKEYKCDQCNREFTQKRHMKTHKRFVHEGIKDHKCDKCDFGCSARNKLDQHKREIHDKIKAYVCDECGVSSSRASNLLSHKRIVHLKLPRFKCKECDFASKKLRYLQEHLTTVHNKEISKYKCELCDYFTIEKSKLRKHKRAVHYKIKEHVCECGFATARKPNLLRHKMVVHLDFKEYQCTACQFACKGERGLKKHQRKIHNTKDDENDTKMSKSSENFCCNSSPCTFTTGSREDMISHMTDVHDKKIEPRAKQEHRGRKRKSSEQAEVLNGVPAFPWILPNEVENESPDEGTNMKPGENTAAQKVPNVRLASISNDEITIEKDTLAENHSLVIKGKIRADALSKETSEGEVDAMPNGVNKESCNKGTMVKSGGNLALQKVWMASSESNDEIIIEKQPFTNNTNTLRLATKRKTSADEQVEPTNSKKVAKESSASIEFVKLSKNTSLKKVPIKLESNNMIPTEKQLFADNKNTRRLATKDKICADLSSIGIEDKITSVGAWLDNLKEKK